MDRTETIQIRLRPRELAELRKRSQAAGMSMSELVRKSALAPQLPESVDRIVAVLIDLRHVLGRSGAMLHQAIARGEASVENLAEYRNQLRRLGRVLRRLE
ncbi:MAG: plasmid mobilization protein [Roseinatronobacter sp.]